MPFGVEQRKPSVTVNRPVVFDLDEIEHDASGAMATTPARYPGSGPVATGREGSALHADHEPT